MDATVEEGRASEPAIEILNVARRFGHVAAVSGVSLTIRKGEFFSLLGPSGCGKTTLLRLIAGLELPDAGQIIVNRRDMAGVPASKRPVNTVFQSYALFPHMTVRDNVAFGLRMKKLQREQIEERVERIVRTLELRDFVHRRPAEISGGQKQRVALARAVVNEPDVLLLDEPLGALDLKLREQLQIELHQLQRRLGITFVYVTHDQREAISMSDRVAVMNAGKIEQLDSPERLYECPGSRFVAQFLGSCNILEGVVSEVEGERLRVQTQAGEVVSRRPPGHPAGMGTAAVIAVRPEKITLVPWRSNSPTDNPHGEAQCNQLSGRVADIIYSGAETRYEVQVGVGKLTAVALNAVRKHAAFNIGDRVRCGFPEESVVLLAR